MAQIPENTTPQSLHPSGLTQQRWEWPFKTPEERKLVAAWFKKIQKSEKNDFEKATL